MVVLRRLMLILLAFAVPLAITALLYRATLFALAATNRTIAPDVLQVSAGIEFVAFLLLMLFEVKNRW